MTRASVAVVLLCVAATARASELDPYDCFGGGRYEAMSKGRVCGDYPDLPAGITCDMVRDQVARFGRDLAKRWAHAKGYTAVEIREAEKCLKH